MWMRPAALETVEPCIVATPNRQIPRRVALRALTPLIALSAIAGAAAVAQQPKDASPAPAASNTSAPAAAKSGKPWVPPGTPGSPIDGQLFHAQVLLDAAGFSPGPIDGKNGSSFKQAIHGFQEANGVDPTGKLDGSTRAALLKLGRGSTVDVKLGPDDVRSTYVYPLPKDPEKQYSLKFLGYRNMLEKVAERYHTTPATVVALN